MTAAVDYIVWSNRLNILIGVAMIPDAMKLIQETIDDVMSDSETFTRNSMIACTVL